MRKFRPDEETDDAVLRDELLTECVFLLPFGKPTTRPQARREFFEMLPIAAVSRPLYGRGAATWDECYADSVTGGVLSVNGSVQMSEEGRSQLASIKRLAESLGISIPGK